MVEEAEPELQGARQLAWLKRLETEHGNLRAALRWTLDPEERAELGLRLAVALWWFLHTRGYLNEGRTWLEWAISSSGAAMPSMRARALNGAGWIALFQAEYEAAKALVEEGLALFREIRDTQGILTCLTHLGLRALPLLREGLRLGWESDYKLAIQHSFFGLAGVAVSHGQPVRAARLWGVVEGMQEAYAMHLMPMTRSHTDYEDSLATARSQLSEEAFVAAWEEGKAMPLEQAIEYALAEEEPMPEEPPATLTRRQREVAALVARGLTNRQIAAELDISEHTVDAHVHKILVKLKLHSRAQVAAWVVEQRLLPEEGG